MNTIVVYCLIFIILLAAELIYFRLADHYNIIDKPNERSSHTRVTLRGGGIVIFVGAWVWAAFFGMKGHEVFLAALTIIATVSFIDDIGEVRYRIRLLLHFTAMLMLFWQWGILSWSLWTQVLIGVIVCAGIINAFNFMDGINGITGAYSLSVIIPLYIINQQHPFVPDSLFVVTAIAVVVFLLFNFRVKARCFCGDVGAVSVAFIIVYMIGTLIFKTGDLSYIILLAVYGVDSLLTIVHRLALHEFIFYPHRKHAYQLMANELKIPHLVVSAFYAGLQLLISLGLIFVFSRHDVYALAVLVLLSAAYVVFKKKYYHLHEEYLRSIGELK
ncbi:MAG: glycosyltransferase family 4 protein [Muribaculaceae bacterium]|nr:glycosyltransferase family 4 protein [Muribaculaceae bacterium]